MVNAITFSQRRRDRLISLRNGFTFVANVTVLSLALLYFSIIPSQYDQFLYLAITILCIGICTSIVYMFGIREVSLSRSAIAADR